MDLHTLTMYQACLMHSRAERVLKSIVSNHLETLSITRMEWLALATVAEKAETKNGHTMSELASVLDVTLSQLNALVAKMITGELVVQSTASQDKRFKFLKITAKGKNLLSRVEIEMRDSMREWLKDININDLKAYMATLHQLGLISSRGQALSKKPV